MSKDVETEIAVEGVTRMSDFLRYAQSGYKDKSQMPSNIVADDNDTIIDPPRHRPIAHKSQNPRSARALEQRATRIDSQRARKASRATRKTRGQAPKKNSRKLMLVFALIIGAFAGVCAALMGDAPNEASLQNAGDHVLLAQRAARESAPIDAQIQVQNLAQLESANQNASSTLLADSALSESLSDPDAPISANAAPNKIIEQEIHAGESLSVALATAGLPGKDLHGLIAALSDTLDLRVIRPGDKFRISRKLDPTGHITDPLEHFEYEPRHGAHKISAVRKGEGFSVEKKTVPLTTEVITVTGSIQTSLYDAIIAEKESVTLVNKFVEMFQWDIDFYRETQKGDHFKIIVEKKFANGKAAGYGRVLAAEFGHGGENLRAFNFESKDQKFIGILDHKGLARQRTFLKSPLEVARITSSYGQRFHPVLKRKKKHNGVDYGAARGTPIWSVADGVVKDARFSSTAGNMVVIKHRNGFETEYFHATRFAKGIKKGVRVKQRQVIAYVGTTGRSTGPHLHFGMRKNGHYVDPGAQKFPNATPMPKAYKAEFNAWAKPLYAKLDALSIKS